MSSRICLGSRLPSDLISQLYIDGNFPKGHVANFICHQECNDNNRTAREDNCYCPACYKELKTTKPDRVSPGGDCATRMRPLTPETNNDLTNQAIADVEEIARNPIILAHLEGYINQQKLRNSQIFTIDMMNQKGVPLHKIKRRNRWKTEKFHRNYG